MFGGAVLAVDRGGVTELRRGPRVAPRVLGPGRAALVPLQAGPLAGDRDAVRLRVGAGAALAVEPIAATVAYPGAARTRLELDVAVEDGGRLVLEDAPLIVAAGADVVRTTTIALGAGAVAAVKDVVVLGRAGEGPGRLDATLRVTGPDGPILHDALRIDPDTWAADAHVALAPATGPSPPSACSACPATSRARARCGGRARPAPPTPRRPSRTPGPPACRRFRTAGPRAAAARRT